MPKLDPYNLPRQRHEGETRTWRLDDPDAPLTLTLRPLSVSTQCAALEEANTLTATYIKGNGLRGAAPFPDPDIVPSEMLFRIVARLRWMQCGPPEETYDTMELLTLSETHPLSFQAAVDWATNGIGGDEPPGE